MLDYAIATLELFGNIEWLAQDRSLGVGQRGYGHSSLIMVFLLRPKGTKSKLGRHVCEPHRLQDHSFIVIVKLCVPGHQTTRLASAWVPLSTVLITRVGVWRRAWPDPSNPPPPSLSLSKWSSLYLTTTLLPPLAVRRQTSAPNPFSSALSILRY